MLNIKRRPSSPVDPVTRYKALVGVLVFAVGVFGTYSILSLMNPGVLDNGGRFLSSLYPSTRSADSNNTKGSSTSSKQNEQQKSSSGKSDSSSRSADTGLFAGSDANSVQPAAPIPQPAAGPAPVSQQPRDTIQSQPSAPQTRPQSTAAVPLPSGSGGGATTATPSTWQPSIPPVPVPESSSQQPLPLHNLVTGVVDGATGSVGGLFPPPQTP